VHPALSPQAALPILVQMNKTRTNSAPPPPQPGAHPLLAPRGRAPPRPASWPPPSAGSPPPGCPPSPDGTPPPAAPAPAATPGSGPAHGTATASSGGAHIHEQDHLTSSTALYSTVLYCTVQYLLTVLYCTSSVQALGVTGVVALQYSARLQTYDTTTVCLCPSRRTRETPLEGSLLFPGHRASQRTAVLYCQESHISSATEIENSTMLGAGPPQALGRTWMLSPGVPAGLEQDDPRGRGEGEPLAAGLDAEHQGVRAGVPLELRHCGVALLCSRGLPVDAQHPHALLPTPCHPGKQAARQAGGRRGGQAGRHRTNGRRERCQAHSRRSRCRPTSNRRSDSYHT